MNYFPSALHPSHDVVVHVRISYSNVFVIVSVFTFVVKVITLAILHVPIRKLLFQVSNSTLLVSVTGFSLFAQAFVIMISEFGISSECFTKNVK